LLLFFSIPVPLRVPGDFFNISFPRMVSNSGPFFSDCLFIFLFYTLAVPVTSRFMFLLRFITSYQVPNPKSRHLLQWNWFSILWMRYGYLEATLMFLQAPFYVHIRFKNTEIILLDPGITVVLNSWDVLLMRRRQITNISYGQKILSLLWEMCWLSGQCTRLLS
jgi:hypothetical protein